MASARSTSEEIHPASTLTLPALEALLGQQEECSRVTLHSALAKKQEAEQLIAQASRAEGEAKSLHVRYEQTEAAIRALRTLIVEKNRQTLEGQFEDTNRSRALGMRSSSSDQMSNPARKRVAGEMEVEPEPSDDEYIPSDEYAGASGHGSQTFVLRTKPNAAILPRGATPRETFAHTFEDHPLRYSNDTTGMTRMVRYDNPNEILIYISGQKVVKSETDKQAGCAAVYETEHRSIMPKPLVFSLEETGLDGAKQSRTTNCATLRAVVAALELKTWASEGWKQVTIATDSSAIHHAVTVNLAKWAAKDWLKGRSVHRPPHPELWSRALDLINEQAYHGCEVRFLLITQKQNQHVAYLARTIAPGYLASEEYQPRGDVGLTFRDAL